MWKCKNNNYWTIKPLLTILRISSTFSDFYYIIESSISWGYYLCFLNAILIKY